MIKIHTKAIVLAIFMLIATDIYASSSSHNHDLAIAKNPWYVRIDAGRSFKPTVSNNFSNSASKTKYTNSMLFDIGFGKRLNEKLRTDLTMTYAPKFKYHDKNSPYSNMDMESIYGMLNLYYDITTYNKFTPYVTLGGGIARNKTGDYVLNNEGSGPHVIYGTSKTSFAGQIGGGVSYNLFQQLDLDLSYRYVSLGRVTTTNKALLNTGVTDYDNVFLLKGRLSNYQLMLGVRYSL